MITSTFFAACGLRFPCFSRFFSLIFLCVTHTASGGDAKRILFLAGPDSHAWGHHEHAAGCRLLSQSIAETQGIEARVVYHWPDSDTLNAASAMVIYADGWHAHPANNKLDELEEFMNAGKGLVALHWATGIQAANPANQSQGDDPRRIKWRELMGADFEAYHSISNFWSVEYDGKSDHPVMHGVRPTKLYDECYFHLRECCPNHGQLERLWNALPPADTVEAGVSSYRGNQTARAAVVERQEQQHVAWAFQREKGGRAFGFTGGHFHWTWANDEVRKMVLNGIFWSAGGDVPKGGLKSHTPRAKDLMGDLSKTGNPGWTEDAMQRALDRAAAGESVNWREFQNKPLPD